MKDELLKAIELALAGEWDAAHRIVQQYESDPIAAWIHAVLHKIEGDRDNSRYWYHRAGRMESAADEPEGELARIKEEIMLSKASRANGKTGNASVRMLALIACLNAWPLVVGLTGCAGDRYNQSADERVEDSRTAERVREALAADADYKYDGVKVTVSSGIVLLSGFVNTSTRRVSAGELAGKVAGVTRVENNLTVKD